MSNAIQPVIESVVDSKVQNGEMFTAHDITLETRTRGHRAGHNEVRDAVHDYYSRGGMGVAYTRTSITVPLGGTPFLYHRSVDDPANYQNIRGQGQVPTPSTSTIAVPAPSSITATDGDDGDDDDDGSLVAVPAGMLSGLSPGFAMPLPMPQVAGVAIASRKARTGNDNAGVVVGRTVDGRQTLSVPTTLIISAGFKPKQGVWVYPVGNTVEVSSSPPHGVEKPSKYTVDSHGQVRITQYILKRAGIGGTKYDLTAEKSKIVVKAH